MTGLTLWGNRGTDLFFGDLFRSVTNSPTDHLHRPQTNVTTTETGYSIDISVPGIDKKDININVENNMMTVSYESTNETKDSFATRSFKRSWTLPEGTDPEFITEECTNGILSVEIPKNSTTIPVRTISIK